MDSSPVVALDLGTIFSGYAFWTNKEPHQTMTGDWSKPTQTPKKEDFKTPKTRTALLLNFNDELDAFGRDAVEKFRENLSDECDSKFRYFDHFRMQLNEKEV